MLELMQYRDFDQVFMIMEQSFPCDEYRTYEEQKSCCKNLITVFMYLVQSNARGLRAAGY